MTPEVSSEEKKKLDQTVEDEVNIFEKEPIARLLATKELHNENIENDNQLKLF